MRGRTALAILAVTAMVIGFGYYFLTYMRVTGSGTSTVAAGGALLFVLFAAAIAGGWYLVLFATNASFGGQLSSEEAADRTRTVRGSGPLLVSARPAVRIGLWRLSTGLVGVSVYQGGIVLKLPLMREHAILGSEIWRVTSEKRWIGPRWVTIQHDCVEVRSTVRLRDPGDRLGAAIRWVAAYWAPSRPAFAAGPATTQVSIVDRLTTLYALAVVIVMSLGLIAVGVDWVFVSKSGVFGLVLIGLGVVILFSQGHELVKRLRQ